MVALHSPAELVLVGVAGESATTWDWLKWLPHVGSEFSPLECSHLASDPTEANVLVAAIEDLIATACGERDDPKETLELPIVLVFISDDAPVERARLVQIAERGPDNGVHVVWHAPSTERLPAACRVFVETDGAGTERAGFVEGGARGR